MMIFLLDLDIKKRGLLTSSTFYQVSANTSAAYSSKSPRRSVSTLTFTLAALWNFADFDRTRIKRTLQSYYICNLLSQPIGISLVFLFNKTTCILSIITWHDKQCRQSGLCRYC